MTASSLVLFLLWSHLMTVAWGYYFSDTTYSTGSSASYTWSSAYPQSCTCMENAVTKSSCSLFRCNCACDLTAQVCDYGCCCDPDCSSEQLSRFQTLGGCPVSSSSNTVPLCYSSVELYKINPRLPLSGQPTAEAAVADALCVSKYNYATKGEYYTTAEVQDSVIFQQSKGQKDYVYGDVSPLAITLDGNFDKGDKIAAFSYNSATLRPYDAGYFSLSLPDFSGHCNDNNVITFENPVPKTKCQRYVSDLAGTSCSGGLSVELIKSQYIAKTSAIRASTGSATTSDLIQVSLASVVYEDPFDGTQTDKTSFFTGTSPTCSTAYIVSAPVATCDFKSKTPTSYTSGNPICKNAVKSVQYVVTHAGDAAGTITEVKAFVVITDVPTEINTTYGYATSDWTIAKDGFTQTFGVEFNGAFTGSTASSDTGNQVTRARSGNPGYIVGKPVLYGTLSSGLIVEQTAGLTVASPLTTYTAQSSGALPFTGGAGECPTATSKIQKIAILFGYDMSTGCSLSLTLADLKALCQATSTTSTPYPTDSSGFPVFLTSFTNGYIGAYGNADPLDPSQWISISKRASSPTRGWLDSTSTCSGMPTGLSYKFLVAAAGEKAFRQNKIISAEVEVIYSNWVMSVPYLDTSSKQSFPLTVTASFINTDYQTITGYAPPAPPVLFKVPYDVFYPFYMSPGAPSPSVSPAVLLAPLAVVCILGFRW